MELFQAKDHYILQQGERALWCSRRDGGLQLRPEPHCIMHWERKAEHTTVSVKHKRTWGAPCNADILEVEAGGSETQDHTQLYSKFQASPDPVSRKYF